MSYLVKKHCRYDANSCIKFISHSKDFLIVVLGHTERSHLDQPANHTRRNDPISEFRTHMLRAISTLSVARQCTILKAILEDSGENPSRVMKEFMDTVPYHHLPCVPTTSPSESPVNTSALQWATDYYVTRYCD
jgi:hypothetical protein